MLRAMLPSEKDVSRYQGEPFVLAADVYSAAGHEGEAGWTWYTGSAGWLLRIVIEDLLGLRQRRGQLYLEPKLPSHWSGCTVRFRGKEIEIRRDRILVDGQEIHGQPVAME